MFKIKEVKPLFTGVITTAYTYKDEIKTGSGLLVDASKLAGTLTQLQRVVACGGMCTEIKPGDIVCLNYKRYAVPQQVPGAIENNKQTSKFQMTYQIPKIEFGDKECLFVQYNDIEYIVTDFEGEEGGLLY